tara:strand:+ start:22984 stop:25581 length:2598 start_codon:yes stop_codon:yes gene_type:complete
MRELENNNFKTFRKFKEIRNNDLWKRFPGWWRAEVVETNDPLNFRRVRFRMPELHDSNVKTEDLPWAVPAPWMGGRNAGSWTHPEIDDIIFINFEKNHAYGPIWTAAADPTRRRSYSLWSTYTRSPQAVKEDGTPAETPQDFEEDYLPKDGRPQSTGFSDRYGNWFNFNSVGFSPKQHKVKPAPVGTDALSKSAFNASEAQPKDNEPDTKYVTMGSKYGNYFFMGDQGYKWFEEFKGNFEDDKDFEVDRYKYLLKAFNEQEAKERDQRRIEIRTRAGHMMEMRDVGWDKSRAGEYGPVKTIGDSKDRDERWIKIRSKGGHLFQMLDVGFDAEKDLFYKRLNKSEFGEEMDEEEELGEDRRMIRLQTRHGNTLILDDRGSDPIDAEGKATPHGNGWLLRTRKGFAIQAVDKTELDHMLFVTPKDQVFELNDRFDYCMMATQSAGELHTEPNPKSLKSMERTKSIYTQSSGQRHDPASNTYHLILDKKNCMVRLKTPEGAGIEMRDQDAPCGEWVETRDRENRALWFSAKDNFTVLRGKKGAKWLLLDDNDDVIVLRNEIGKIQIRAKKSIELISDDGDICLKAEKGQIGLTSKTIEMSTNGATHKIDASGIGTSKTIQGARLEGFHPQMGCAYQPGGAFAGSGAGANATKPGNPCKPKEKEITRKKPDDFDKERGCDDVKDQKGDVPTEVIISPPGGGGGGGGGGQTPSNPPDPSPNAPDGPGAPVPPIPAPPIDPIEDANPGGGGVLWFGVSNKFKAEIEEFGLQLDSFANLLNLPPNVDATEIRLSKTLETARGNQQAVLSQRRYGDVAAIYRIRNVTNPDLLLPVEGDDTVLSYSEDLEFNGNIELFEIGTAEFTTPPLFPGV